MHLRNAVSGDAQAICTVLRRSITMLCAADHGDDPAILEDWLRNKTPEAVRSWVADSGQIVRIATRDPAILGVAATRLTGDILLNYVSPDARFQGVSKALMADLERALAERGVTTATLTSTRTALPFYRAIGYVDHGPPVMWRGSPAFPLRKRLSP